MQHINFNVDQKINEAIKRVGNYGPGHPGLQIVVVVLVMEMSKMVQQHNLQIVMMFLSRQCRDIHIEQI